MDDQDDGNAGRSGRVRKKSAKVLEMEEFEQAEKVSHVVKKVKSHKVSASNTPASDDNESAGKTSGKKSKLLKSGSSNLEATPQMKTVKTEKNSFPEASRAVPSELSLRVPQTQTQIVSPKAGSPPTGQEFKPDPSITAAAQPASVKKEDSKSVIKYLLSSPTAGSTAAGGTKIAAPLPSTPESSNNATPKAVKRQKSEEKGSKSKPKEKRPKIEILSPSELIPVGSVKSPTAAPKLKMKITGGSNPLNAQVALDFQESSPETAQAAKPKKTPKKTKIKQEDNIDVKPEIPGLANDEPSPPVKKAKVSKKKEKLIQDAISAVQQMPNLAALVASAGLTVQGVADVSPLAQKPQKKKTKASPAIKSEPTPEDDLQSNSLDVDHGESTLVIAEKEKKKKKASSKKKASKDKDEASGHKAKKVKIPKRAPTAYMLFCNLHRPTIVAENPGIEFAGISRKLGELWQTQSNKQKLQWRRKAQRRMKKCNLISTGKTGKESQGASGSSTVNVLPAQARLTQYQKLANMLQKNKGTLVDEAPLSPTKNFSIEPMDVAAHLKLLGESLSIIGMRLQEHKGMIAVQGSLSVLLDSLICACGPLLCLTQQVPGMDGCSPSLHAQTLDSVAYVMPGL